MEKEDFYREIKCCIQKYFADNALMDELLAFQKDSVAVPFDTEKTLAFSYDWQEYFENIFDAEYKNPKKKENRIKFLYTRCDSWADYAKEIVWYGRRAGKTIKNTECI